MGVYWDGEYYIGVRSPSGLKSRLTYERNEKIENLFKKSSLYKEIITQHSWFFNLYNGADILDLTSLDYLEKNKPAILEKSIRELYRYRRIANVASQPSATYSIPRCR